MESVFPENNNGSRIIVTTRITDVAKSCCSNSGDQLHQMAHLDDVDSRRLFFKRIFHSDNSCPTELEKVSYEILKKCAGLPLAIITIASLLATKPQNKDEWESLQDSIGIGSSHETDHSLQGIKDILFLSYCDLPRHLKTCLLYISIYPEDYEIKSKELIWKWIAEGFITKQGRNLEQVAKSYLNDLVNRSMIQSKSVADDGSVSTCGVHDLVLDLIISLSDEENFVTVLDGHERSSLPSKIRRLSLQCSDSEHSKILATTESKSHVRSLNVFGALEQIPPLADFHALRVLDLSRCGWLENMHINCIGSLFQLRYLHLASKKITELPEDIGNLQYLLTLDLSFCRGITRMPSTMVRLKKLVRLIVDYPVTFTAHEFGSMQDLEELNAIRRCDNPIRLAEEFRRLTKLRSLNIGTTSLANMSGDSERFAEVLSSSLSELGRCNLRYLEMDDNYLFENSSSTFPHLKLLKINGSLPGVPREMASLTNLVKLFIMFHNFEDEDLHVLMSLPSLTDLELSLFDEGMGTNKTITVGSEGFKLLEVFVCELEPDCRTMLVLAPSAMPALQRLYFHIWEREMMSRYCGGAGFGIEHHSNLKHFRVELHFCGPTPTRGEIQALAAAISRATAKHFMSKSIHVCDVLGAAYSCNRFFSSHETGEADMKYYEEIDS